jgi:hypothetical protein
MELVMKSNLDMLDQSILQKRRRSLHPGVPQAASSKQHSPFEHSKLQFWGMAVTAAKRAARAKRTFMMEVLQLILFEKSSHL